jgi:hypothetical protein
LKQIDTGLFHFLILSFFPGKGILILSSAWKPPLPCGRGTG